MSGSASQQRFLHALSVFLRAEFGASVGAVAGFLDILVADAKGAGAEDFLPDLERMQLAAQEISALIAQILALPIAAAGAAEERRFRHDLRTPLGAIKGYGELLLEEARERGRESLVPDLEKIVSLAERLLGEIDGFLSGGARAPAPTEAVTSALLAIKPLEGSAGAEPRVEPSRVLVVDDNPSNRDLLARWMAHEGHRPQCAQSGEEALGLVEKEDFDLVLLDLMMPGMSGFEVLSRLKANERTRPIRVIMISALDEIDSAVRSIEAGAEDYLTKPFNPVLLRARVNASLERRRLREREKEILEELRREKERSERLLLNVLPRPIVERLRQGESVIADHITEATILFSDIVDFTALASRLPAEETVAILGLVFSRFDALAARMGLEKIKTIGDGYMVAGGLPEERADHAAAVAAMGFEMLAVAAATGAEKGLPLRLRIGLHSGELIAGVIGMHRFVYDVWGDTVNTAKRMESYGAPDRIHVSAATRGALGEAFLFEPRGPIEIKGKGLMETFFIERVR